MNKYFPAALAGLVLAAAACDLPAPDDGVSRTTAPIIGGKAAALCEWPTSIMLGGGCSGTLVHPRVVMTAKHCLGANSTPNISFGESRGTIAKTVRAAKCFRAPQGDFGFCTLSEDVTGIPIIPAMAACEMSELKVGKLIVESGFGNQTGQRTGSGTKKWIEGRLVRGEATRNSIQVTTGTQDGEYFGDSGGPAFFKMPDGTWRLIGNDSSSPDWNNSGEPRVSTYSSVPYHVAWAEQQSGIDITPCHDATGGWNPGPDCKGSPTNPGEGTGTWANACAGQTMVLTPTCTVGDAGISFDVLPPPIDSGGGAADSRADTRPNDTGGAALDVRAADATSPAADVAPAADTGAGQGPDTPPRTIPGAQADAGAKPQAGLTADGGCACAAAGGSPAAGSSLALLLGVAALLRRRKPRQRQDLRYSPGKT